MDRQDHAVAKPKQEEITPVAAPHGSLNSFGVIIFFVVLVEIVLLIGLNLYQTSRVKTLSNQLIQRQSELSSGEYQTINRQVEEVLSGTEKLKTVLASKNKWSTFYSRLNAVTPRDVKINNVSINADGSFKMDGVTSSLTSLANALAAWTTGGAGADTPFSSVTLNSNGYVNEGQSRRVSFTVTGQIDLGGLNQ